MKVKFVEKDVDLIFVEISGVNTSSDGSGTFYVSVKNSTKTRQVHSIGIKSNHALMFTCNGRQMNSKPVTFAESRIETILPGEEKKVLVSWRDISPESKVVEIVAMFKSATSEPCYIA